MSFTLPESAAPGGLGQLTTIASWVSRLAAAREATLLAQRKAAVQAEAARVAAAREATLQAQREAAVPAPARTAAAQAAAGRPVGALTPGENPQLDVLIARNPASADWTKREREQYEWWLLFSPATAARIKAQFNLRAQQRLGVTATTAAREAALQAQREAARAATAREAVLQAQREAAAQAAARTAAAQAEAQREATRQAAAQETARRAAAAVAEARVVAPVPADAEFESVLEKVRRMAKKSDKMNRLIAGELLRARGQRKAAAVRARPFVLELRDAMQATAAEHPGLKGYAPNRREYV